MDRKDYLKSRISESLKGPIEESYKKKYETAPEGVKAVADHMAMLKKQPTDTLERMVNQHYKVHSAKSKNEFVGMLMRAKFGKKKLEAHDSHFQTEQKQRVVEGSGYNIDQADRDEFHPDEITRIKQAHFPDKLRRNLRDKKIAQAKQDRFNKLRGSGAGGDSKHITPVGHSSNNTYESVAKKVEPVNEASQKLMNYLRAKHGAALQKMSSPELQKAKKAAAAEMKAKTVEKKAAAAEAPKEKVKDTGEHIVVQMRKIADYKPGKYPVRVSPKRSVDVHSDTARKVVASHDQLKKPVDKRQFRISLTKRLRKLKEERARC